MQKPHVDTVPSFPFLITHTTYIPDAGQSWKDFSAEVQKIVGDLDKELVRFDNKICLRTTEAVKNLGYFEPKQQEPEAPRRRK